MIGEATMKHEDCIESLAAEKYILGELPELEREQFEEHYFSCPECAESVRCLSELRGGVQLGLGYPAEMAQAGKQAGRWLPKLWPWWLRPQAAMAGALAAIAVAAITGYQNLQMRGLLRAQAVQSVALQPATRGDVPTIRANPLGAFILVEADLPGASGNLTWSLRADGAERVLDGKATAPEPGLSFKLLLPAAVLEAPEYTLAVRSDAGKEWLFRFRTRAS